VIVNFYFYKTRNLTEHKGNPSLQPSAILAFSLCTHKTYHYVIAKFHVDG